MISASVRAYLDGKDTTYARRRILVDYLNSMPLTARLGFGEVNGLGDGLWAWYGTDFKDANEILKQPARNAEERLKQAEIYKQVLSLLLAQRRPTHYLIADRNSLNDLADSHLRLLASQATITPELRDAALSIKLRFRNDAAAAAVHFVCGTKGRQRDPCPAAGHAERAEPLPARPLRPDGGNQPGRPDPVAHGRSAVQAERAELHRKPRHGGLPPAGRRQERPAPGDLQRHAVRARR